MLVGSFHVSSSSDGRMPACLSAASAATMKSVAEAKSSRNSGTRVRRRAGSRPNDGANLPYKTLPAKIRKERRLAASARDLSRVAVRLVRSEIISSPGQSGRDRPLSDLCRPADDAPTRELQREGDEDVSKRALFCLDRLIEPSRCSTFAQAAGFTAAENVRPCSSTWSFDR